MNTALRETGPLSTAVLTEAVQLIEQAGPLDDAGAMREAMTQTGGAAARIDRRAAVLGRRIGLQAELARGGHWAPWVGLALVAVVVLAGLALAGNVVGGNERRINIMVALVSLLGLHLLTLGLWLLGLVLPMTSSFGISFGRMWLALTARVAGGRHGQAPVLLRAAMQLLSRARLLPWALGFVSHAIWSLSFAVVLASLLFALAFRSYTLNWETTILDPSVFVEGVRLLGRAPGWLGFPVPEASTVLASSTSATGQREWALWLTGCIVVYGLLPRIFFALLSAGIWQRRKRALRPDLSAHYFRKLIARFDAMAPALVVDADPGIAHERAPIARPAGEVGDAVLAVGYELPEELPWPPGDLSPGIGPVLRIDGGAQQRRELIATATRLRPRLLVVACNAASSPDRGTERLLRELLGHCGACRIWLVAGDDAARRRWRHWLADSGLDAITAHDDPVGALGARG